MQAAKLARRARKTVRADFPQNTTSNSHAHTTLYSKAIRINCSAGVCFKGDGTFRPIPIFGNWIYIDFLN
jgi:hypothetical protein